LQDRKCSVCSSYKTYVRPNGYEDWFINSDTKFIICKRCYQQRYRNKNRKKIRERQKIYRDIHKGQITEYRRRRVAFKGKQITVESCPRLGQCTKCSRRIGDDIKRTNMHHDEYHEYDVLKDTRELCLSCHLEEHGHHKILDDRKCSICSSDKTYIRPSGRGTWRINKDTGLIICGRCYMKKRYFDTKMTRISLVDY
jgi:hypothetical protein